MIIDNTNCQTIPPIKSSQTVIMRFTGPGEAIAGATIKARMGIGTAAKAQIVRILAKLYWPFRCAVA